MADKVSKQNPVRERREEEKAERRRQILDAAERVIAKEGWENTDFGKIAKVARLSRSLVYVYFPARDDLFHAVCGRGLVDLEKRFAAAMARRRTGIEQVMELGKAYHAFAREQPLYFDIIAQFNGKEVHPEERSGDQQEAHAHGRGCLAMLATALATGVKDGSVRKSIGDVHLASLSIWAFAHGLIQIASAQGCLLQQDFEIEPDQMIEHGLRLLRSSLAAERG